MKPRAVRRRRSVVITGAGTGLGREIALGFAAKGWVVFGTASSVAEVRDLTAASGRRVSLAVCDVSRIDAVRAWAGGVADAVDGAGLDLLVNAACACPYGPIELLSLDTLRRAFEVNVFGAISVINAFLPALRIARGKVIQMSRWTATVPLPFDGAAAASLAAIETLMSVYRAELEPCGIELLTVPTSAWKPADEASASAVAAARLVDGMTPAERDLYGKRLGIAADHFDGMRGSEIEMADAAARVIGIAESGPAPPVTAIGADAETMLRTARGMTDAEIGMLARERAGLATQSTGP
ncbi:SDR family NAD(P)-dependent oxidoreductase [Sphingomonas naphthae]|uniref:SDR family NAD(P)-dependent oxidoreductase n=1 Tax=Sphingomonas naphthae TaxID=1813468 RepID=A0ABY7TIT4_9SPHN|nr:SDR family NAD(P)-dependent oxidoreductase [Sphingomonas naphthae]WCT73054.1 SDR family NAD(P)-dependent oxidoreductase [Sphingomonas naphthae]